MRIGILGPLEVRDTAGNLVPVGGARLRSLLIRLAIEDGRPVSVDRLSPGGAGKTRLSIEASARMSDQLPDGVWFVPLAPVRDALDVPQAVLTAIGMQEASWPGDPARRGGSSCPVDAGGPAAVQRPSRRERRIATTSSSARARSGRRAFRARSSRP